MELTLLSVGRAGALWRDVIAEYEARAGRYFRLKRIEVREAGARGKSEDVIRREEGSRLLSRAPDRADVVALARDGALWSSEQLADYLKRCMDESRPGVAFVVGGAYGLGNDVLDAGTRLSLSHMTLPHELALALLLEQIYRAGTMLRGEPYHKGGVPRRRGGEGRGA
jgi:23S rRNA (pseudouridine1915-N3)-methyltransferase